MISAIKPGLTGRVLRFLSLLTVLPFLARSNETSVRSLVLVAPGGAKAKKTLVLHRARATAPKEPIAFKVDSPAKSHTVQPGEQSCTFTFTVTNISDAELVIARVRTTCGCSVAKMPNEPWTLAPGASGFFEVAVDLVGKTGSISKIAIIETCTESKAVSFTVTIPAALMTEPGMQSRAVNMQLAAADRQAVFKGDCVRCHVTPTVGLTGQKLYAAACGICHEAEHRATMVPDLRALPFATNRDFWKHMATYGKPSTLMPAFSQQEGGPLDPEQIESIADYLVRTYSPGHPTTAKATPPAPE
jgi:cytochrome c553